MRISSFVHFKEKSGKFWRLFYTDPGCKYPKHNYISSRMKTFSYGIGFIVCNMYDAI